ncbi:hypothetical protein SAMN04489844_1031 [Nocardioides exalbidus]|uniref:Uncharacterized protein n=1 Tax=Nocardioides exalbidus TaxID=402596 RepID=A0A1H4M4G8_9ACTN|nr:hypothetical protein [Nocardioides exalbidus]SEB77405.1 hypothetical protein SAMN04489844_1031 [Nocardioides exalbidus]
MPRTRTTLAASAVLLLLATACASGGGDREAPAPSDDPSWTTSTDPVATDGLVWAEGSVVHLPDGSTVDTGGAMTTYVVAGDGVYFTPADGDDVDHANMTTGPLSFADRDGAIVETGLTVYVESLGSSPDGRYLGVVDATSGPEDDFSDYHQATAVVVDLTTGERVVDTTDGMGDPTEDDLAHDYPETNLSVRFPDAGTAYVEGLGGIAYALPGGEGTEVDPIDSPVRSPLDPTSPDGRWRIDDRGAQPVLLSADGERLRPRTGTDSWEPGWWLDDTTVLGVAPTGPGGTRSVITCVVPDGACTSVEGTAGAVVRLPVDTSPTDLLDLGGAPQ